MPEIDILSELKDGYEGLNTIDPAITKILLQQDNGEIKLNVFRGEKCKTSKSLKFQLYGSSWADENLNPIEKGEVCPEWQFSANDPLPLNKNRLLYGHSELYLDELGISSLPKDLDKTFLMDTEYDPNPLMIKKLEQFLSRKGYRSGLVSFDLTDGSFIAQLGETQGDGPMSHIGNIYPTETGIRLEEV